MGEMINALIYEDLEPRSVDVRLGKKLYRLREADQATVMKWKNIQAKGARLKEGKLVSMEGFGEREAILVCLCLFEVTEQGEKPVTRQFIDGLRSKIVSDLFQTVKKMSELVEPGDSPEDDMTAEELTNRIDELIERLDKKRQTKEQLSPEETAKNGLSPTPASSV